jgi:hypothetical protein
MRHPIRTTLLVVAAVVLLTGCTTSQDFRLVLLVLDKESGRPIPIARIELDDQVNEERKEDYSRLEEPNPLAVVNDDGKAEQEQREYRWRAPATDGEGKLEYGFRVSPYPPYERPWYLRVVKKGYEPVVIDIHPYPEPAATRGRISQPVIVEMTPKKKPHFVGPPLIPAP